ncbi:uncharacterized protein LOC130748936 [Lotus japonicus]|uniref:uncharacterized protein LOC130748936 n=1 Tax=Lotus japonicus TaxID=34305 RepID=UPI002585B8E8|nr:uncharacterized protein LOC130748936 [Lotus japonicus]
MHHSSGLVLLWVYPLGAKSENTPSDASSELFMEHVDPSILGKLFIPLLSLALENALSELLVLICKPFDPGILAEKSLVTHEPLHGFQAYHLCEVQLVLHLWFCLVKLEHLLQHVTLWQGHSIGDGFLWHSIVVDKSIGTSLAVGRDSWSYFSQSQLKILEMELDKTCLAWDPLVCFRTEFTSQTLYSFHGLWTHSTTLLEWILIIAWIVYFSSLRTRMFSRGW